MRERSSGILMHVSSLPGEYGIGDFGLEAYKFVDFLEKSKQSYWQILPLGITGFGDSPYQSFSSFAGNPYFIDLDEFIKEGFLDEEGMGAVLLSHKEEKVDYSLLYKNKYKLLRKAYRKAYPKNKKEIIEFYSENKDWLYDFALFMAIKGKFNDISWQGWPLEYREHKSSYIKEFEEEKKEEISFWVFTQYYFFKQWKRLKEYANNKGIYIIGDLPFYVSEDSADLWKNSHLFKVDSNLRLRKLAGVPPDYFSPTGQLWGNPIYDWKKMEDENYKWWINRLKFNLKQVDLLRLDHFRAFASYWEVDSNAEDARHGEWRSGPGIRLFKLLENEIRKDSFIAEDLGMISSDVDKLLNDTGFPNMKVLQFGFSLKGENSHTKHRIGESSLVYTGTHDNPTSIAWINSLTKEEFTYVKEYLKLNEEEGFNWGFIRGAWSSNAYLAIAPLQDFLGLEDERLNTPGTSKNNWTWRLSKDKLTDELAMKIRQITELYGR